MPKKYIDADYLLKELSFYADRPTKSAMKMIKDIALHPANVVEPKKGKWIPYSKVYECRYNCSLCGYDLMGIHESEAKFCPNCGADMREEKEDG